MNEGVCHVVVCVAEAVLFKNLGQEPGAIFSVKKSGPQELHCYRSPWRALGGLLCGPGVPGGVRRGWEGGAALRWPRLSSRYPVGAAR